MLQGALHLITGFTFGRGAFLIHPSFDYTYWCAKGQPNTCLYMNTLIVEIELVVP